MSTDASLEEKVKNLEALVMELHQKKVNEETAKKERKKAHAKLVLETYHRKRQAQIESGEIAPPKRGRPRKDLSNESEEKRQKREAHRLKVLARYHEKKSRSSGEENSE